MGANLYTQIWKEAFPSIIKGLALSFEKGKEVVGQMPKEDFETVGNRQRYTFTVTIDDGYAAPKAGSAVCRDLQEVLNSSKPFRDFAAGKTITFRLDGSFILHIMAYSNT